MPQNILHADAQEPLELLYRNGQAETSSTLVATRFTDICLTKSSQKCCDDLIQLAGHFTAIRNQKECQECIALHALVVEIIKNLRKLTKKDRQPFTNILSQIAAATEPIQTKLILIEARIDGMITDWRTMIVEGERREAERLAAAAQEKHNESKYTDDPKKKRQATVEAKQLEKAAKAAAPQPEKSIDTEEYWEGVIVNRSLAAKLPNELVCMDIDQGRLNQRVKELQKAGERITPNQF